MVDICMQGHMSKRMAEVKSMMYDKVGTMRVAKSAELLDAKALDRSLVRETLRQSQELNHKVMVHEIRAVEDRWETVGEEHKELLKKLELREMQLERSNKQLDELKGKLELYEPGVGTDTDSVDGVDGTASVSKAKAKANARAGRGISEVGSRDTEEAAAGVLHAVKLGSQQRNSAHGRDVAMLKGVGMRLLAKARQERERAATDKARLAELENETLPLAKKTMRISDEKIRSLNEKVKGYKSDIKSMGATIEQQELAIKVGDVMGCGVM